MISVFDYLDYREYLSDWFLHKKQESNWYSYKVMGNGVGLDASQVYRILGSKLHISKAARPRFVEYLEMEGSESEYFLLLIEFSRAKTEGKSRELFNEILTLRGSRSRLLKGEQLRMYEEWYYPIIRSLVNVLEISDNYEVLARSVTPKITVNQVKKALNHLKRLQLVERGNDGIWKACEPSVTTGSDFHSLMVRQYLKDSLGLAKESIDLHTKDTRDVNVINMAVDENAFEDCKAILEECRRQIQQRVENVRDPDRVLRLAQAMFPVADISLNMEKQSGGAK